MTSDRGARPATTERRVVTVFGSSRIERDSAAYQEAYELGRLLAEHGYVVCNGGYTGSMEGVARGAREAGGHTIGVTVEIFGERQPNEYIDEIVATTSLIARLERLTEPADAYVVLTGGLGTLLEMALVWNLHSMHVQPDKPILLLGPAWRAAIECFSRHLLIRDWDLAGFTFVESPAEALAALRRVRSPGQATTDWSG